MTTITIIYKSGAKVHLRVEEFSIRSTPTGGIEYTWNVGEKKLGMAYKRPILIGADDIAAVFEGKV